MDEMRDRDIRENTDQESLEEKHPGEEMPVQEGERQAGNDPVEEAGNAPSQAEEEPVNSAEEKSPEPEENPSADNAGTEKSGEDKEPTEEEEKAEPAVAGEDVKESSAADETVSEKEDAEAAGKEEITVEEVDYSTFTPDKLIARLELLVSERPVQEIRDDVEHIKVNFYKKIHQETEEKKKRFLEEGGDPLEFKPAPDPREERLKDLLKVYRHKKSVYNREQEEQKQKNLEEKYRIIEAIKNLTTSKESMHKTFQEFRELQEKWRNTGLVPQQYVNDLWETYHYNVEKFYDYIKLNRELRDLDLKKNMEMKLRLCEQVEQLMLEPDIVGAFKTLQKYHEQWREIGPVPKEHKNELWERFREGTRKINKKYQAYFQEIKEIQKKNLEQKISLAEKAEELASEELHTHKAWEERSNEIRELQKIWKTIGFAPRKQNNAIYERFRKACDLFFTRKREYYAANKETQMNNLQMKTDLCIQAEALQDSTDWKKTTQDLINLQKKWKEIGPVPKKYSDQIWKRFRAACDKFFENKSNYFKGLKENYEENLQKKEALIEEILNYELSGDTNKDFSALQDFQRRWTEIGYVPYEKKEEIAIAYKNAVDQLFNRLDISEHTRNLIKYKAKLQELTGSPKAAIKIRKDQEKFINRIKQLESDITIWENNIGFFSNSKNAESLIKDVSAKIENAKASIALLKEKLRLIEEMDID